MKKFLCWTFFGSLAVVVGLYYQDTEKAPDRSIASEESCRQIVQSIIDDHEGEHISSLALAKGERKAFVKIPTAYFSSSDKEHAALMLDLIKKEKKSISIAYYQTDGNKVGNVFFAALAEAAQRGVKVRLLLDAWNPDDWIDTPVSIETLKALSDLGVEVRYFNNVERNSTTEKALSFLKTDKFNRMHDKVAIFEEQNFLITGDRMPQNSNFRIQKRKGATVRDENKKIVYSFNYLSVMAAINSGEVTKGSLVQYEDLWKLGSPKNIELADNLSVEIRKKNLKKFLTIAERGDFNSSLDNVYKGLRPISGAEFVSDSINKYFDPYALGVSKHILQMFKEANEEIVIFSPYLNLTGPYLQEIYAAIDRGVKVTFVLPSWESIDTPLTLQIWEKQAAELKGRGVNIIQHQGKDFMHAKIAIVDNKKTFIGSYNFNPRSTFTDHESGIIVSDLDFGQSVMAFKKYLEQNESRPFEVSKKTILERIKISIIKKLMSWSFFLYRQF